MPSLHLSFVSILTLCIHSHIAFLFTVFLSIFSSFKAAALGFLFQLKERESHKINCLLASLFCLLQSSKYHLDAYNYLACPWIQRTF